MNQRKLRYIRYTRVVVAILLAIFMGISILFGIGKGDPFYAWLAIFLFGLSVAFDVKWIVEHRGKKADVTLENAQKLCEIYFNIAANVIGEDEVRRQRDEAIANETTPPESAPEL